MEAGALQQRLRHERELHVRFCETGVLEARRNEVAPLRRAPDRSAPSKRASCAIAPIRFALCRRAAVKIVPLSTARSILIPRRLSPEKSCPERSADAKFARWPWRHSVSRYSRWSASFCSISSPESTRTGGRVEKSAIPAKGDRGRSESDIARSYSECRRTTRRVCGCSRPRDLLQSSYAGLGDRTTR